LITVDSKFGNSNTRHQVKFWLLLDFGYAAANVLLLIQSFSYFEEVLSARACIQ
jgi:hypothetical protein